MYMRNSTNNTHQNDTILLSDEHIIAKGNARVCYLHPLNQNLCIKLPVRAKSIRGIKKETNYYKFLKKKNIDWTMIARYHGPIKTNLGVGEVFDLIRDDDGSISKSMRYYLRSSDEIHYSKSST